VRVAVAARHGVATVVGAEIRSDELLRVPDMPDLHEGVWIDAR
jgi:hypothetical protein